MKLVLDMNLSPKWIGLLRVEGWETFHWSQLGRPDASDSEIMNYAAQNEAVLMTQDLDFGAILAVTRGRKPSVIQIRDDNSSVEHLGDRVVSTLRHVQDDLERGALVTIETDRIRLRSLPLLGEE